jgi:hypothetical protein
MISNFVVSKLFDTKPQSKILILSYTKALQEHYRYLLQRNAHRSIPIQTVDSHYYTWLMDQALPGDILWPQSSIYLLTSHYLKNKKIRESIFESDWDLIIIDDIESYTERDLKRFGELISTGAPILFFGNNAQRIKGNLKELSPDRVEYIEDSIQINRPEVHFKPIPYEMTHTELNIQRIFNDAIIQVLKLPKGNSFKRILSTAFASSPMALGSVVGDQINFWKPIRNKAAHSLQLNLNDFDIDDQKLENIVNDQTLLSEINNGLPTDIRINTTSLLLYIELLIELRNALFELDVDSKLDALLNHYGELIKTGRTGLHIIVTKYKSTATYLAGSLEGIFPSVKEFTMNTEHDVLSNVDGNNQIIILTTNSFKKLKGIEKTIESLFLYDLSTEREFKSPQYVTLYRFRFPDRLSGLKVNYLKCDLAQ